MLITGTCKSTCPLFTVVKCYVVTVFNRKITGHLRAEALPEELQARDPAAGQDRQLLRDVRVAWPRRTADVITRYLPL